MDESTQRSLDRRLARIEGQVRGLRRMISEQEYCCDVLTQVSATRSALDHVGSELAVLHVKHCILGHGTNTAHPRTIAMSDEELIDELRATLNRLVG